MVLLGLHSKADTPDGLLAHTYEHDVAELLLNGVSVGEIGMEAAIAGDFGVATVMMIGDSAGAAEARALLPGIVTVETKRSLGGESAVCRPHGEVLREIRQAAARVAGQPPPVEPYPLAAPVSLEIRFRRGPYLDALRRLHADRMAGGDRLALSGSTATEVWATYWQLKPGCQAEIKRRSSE
jgi:D-amino peptidase